MPQPLSQLLSKLYRQFHCKNHSANIMTYVADAHACTGSASVWRAGSAVWTVEKDSEPLLLPHGSGASKQSRAQPSP